MRINRLSLLITLTFLALNFSCQQESAKESISPKEFQEKLEQNPDAQLIDVRTPEEFESGHLKDAVNIDYYSDDFEHQLNTLDKKEPVFVYCRSGNRSGSSADILRKKGFKVYDLEGGITKWKNEGLEVEK